MLLLQFPLTSIQTLQVQMGMLLFIEQVLIILLLIEMLFLIIWKIL